MVAAGCVPLLRALGAEFLMTLTELLNRDMRIEWHESVALLREMLDAAPEGAADSGSMSTFDDTELLPAGAVRVHALSHTEEPVRQFGEMVAELFARGDPPVQLRLVASQSHESVQAYSEALAFFERPDRTGTLQQLYNRASAALPLIVAAPDPTFNEAEAAEEDAVHPERSAGRTAIYAAGAAGIVAVIALAMFLPRHGDGAPASEAGLSSQVSKGIGGVTAKV